MERVQWEITWRSTQIPVTSYICSGHTVPFYQPFSYTFEGKCFPATANGQQFIPCDRKSLQQNADRKKGATVYEFFLRIPGFISMINCRLDHFTRSGSRVQSCRSQTKPLSPWYDHGVLRFGSRNLHSPKNSWVIKQLRGFHSYPNHRDLLRWNTNRQLPNMVMHVLALIPVYSQFTVPVPSRPVPSSRPSRAIASCFRVFWFRHC